MNTIADCKDVLKYVARQNGSRVTDCETYDPHVCTTKMSLTSRPPIRLVSGQPLSRRTSYQDGACKVQVEASDEYLMINAGVNVETEAMSINRPDKIQALKGEVPNSLAWIGYPVFTMNGSITANQSVILDHPRMRDLLNSVILTESESIHIYANGIVVYLRCHKITRIEDALDRAVKLANDLSSIVRPSDLSGLPEEFVTLLPLIRLWGITDDQQRDDLRVNTARAELENVVTKVDPYLGAIDSYLDSFEGRPWTGDAIALGALAEFTVETKAYLRRQDRG